MGRPISHLLITLPDFERIFRTIHGVLLNEQGDPSRACLFFGTIGAAILREHHRLDAQAVAGLSMYKLDLSSDVLALAAHTDGAVTAAEHGFHCWVECEGWVLDFSSALFREMLAAAGKQRLCTRQMFQKPGSGQAVSPEALTSPGDFFCKADTELTATLLAEFHSRPAYNDILDICLQWYRPSPKRMLESIGVGDAKGRVKSTQLSPLRLTGAW